MHTRTAKDLIVWQKSMDLVENVYRITKQLPRAEQFGLVSQTQRCATSVPSNIAEGYARNNRNEYIQFLGIAKGSSSELETQILLVERLYPNVRIKAALSQLIEIQKMLAVMIRKLKST